MNHEADMAEKDVETKKAKIREKDKKAKEKIKEIEEEKAEKEFEKELADDQLKAMRDIEKKKKENKEKIQ